jgi:hypothetical protein
VRGAPTPRIDQLAAEGLRLTQFLVEPACTPSRAALMTGQYSIRSGLSLVVIPGTPNTLSARAITMGELFKSAGYATALFGKWHLGSEPQSLPTAHGFDEFYGIPPDLSWSNRERQVEEEWLLGCGLSLHEIDGLVHQFIVDLGPDLQGIRLDGAQWTTGHRLNDLRALSDQDVVGRRNGVRKFHRIHVARRVPLRHQLFGVPTFDWIKARLLPIRKLDR